MAEKLERKVMEVYGENAAARDIIAYGSDIAGNIVETKDPDVIQTEAYKTGVRSAVVGNNSTTLQNRQALDFLFSRQLKYLYQHGIAEWGATETYFVNSFAVGSDGNLYVSLTDNNKGKDPTTDTTNWQAFPTPAEIAKKVNKAGDTMTGHLIFPSNTTVQFGSNQRKHYYITYGSVGELALYHIDENKVSKGLFINKKDPHEPYYFDGEKGYRLLTTADLSQQTNPIKLNYSAQVSGKTGFQAPSNGFMFIGAGSNDSEYYLHITDIDGTTEVLNLYIGYNNDGPATMSVPVITGQKAYITPACKIIFVPYY